jgi:hypothetical protein
VIGGADVEFVPRRAPPRVDSEEQMQPAGPVRPRGSPALIAALAALVVTACAAGPSAPAARLAPPIPGDQLDLAGFAASPCDLLRADRVARRHLSVPGTVVNDVTGRMCRWNRAEGTHASIAVGADMSHDLEWVYRHRLEYGSFRPSDVSHYPTADTTTAGHTPLEGSCTARVGIANNNLLIVTADYLAPRSRFTHSDACQEADSVGFEIITQLLGSS